MHAHRHRHTHPHTHTPTHTHTHTHRGERGERENGKERYRKGEKEREREEIDNNEHFFQDAFDFELLKDTLQRLKEGRKVEVPIYNFVSHSRAECYKTFYLCLPVIS
jgi:Phosphoribulokinase / Uridine kinase family